MNPYRRSTIIAATVFLLGLAFGVRAAAQETSPSNPYSGDLWRRSTLSGDWWGVRNDLAAKGLTIEMSVTQVGQGVVGGGKNGAWEYGGRGDMVMNVDSGKLGLWPGGFLNFELEGNWASSVNPKTGALMPVNTNQMLPLPPGDIFGIPALNFTQFLSPYFGLTIGKYATITETSGDMNEFAHGKGNTQFMNGAFNFNPAMLLTVPYSVLGTGIIVLPTKDPKEAIVNLLVLQTNGTATTSGFEDLNGNKITVAGEGRLRTDFFGLTGHQLFGVSYSNKKFTALDQSVRLITENRAFEGSKGSWNIYYNFDQYLYEPKKGSGQGAGIFGRFGASDGNPNPIHFFYSIGIGGKGIIPGRPLDRFGLGYYFIDVKSPELQNPPQTTKFLRDEYGFEAFYNFALTPWMMLTPDIQIVRGAQKDKITLGTDSSGIPFIASRKHIGTATILGLRLQLAF